MYDVSATIYEFEHAYGLATCLYNRQPPWRSKTLVPNDVQCASQLG